MSTANKVDSVVNLYGAVDLVDTILPSTHKPPFITTRTHSVNKTEWISTERALTPLRKAKQAHTSRNSEMPIPFQWPSPTLLPALWRVSDSCSTASTDTGPLESPSARVLSPGGRDSPCNQLFSAVQWPWYTSSICLSVSWISRHFTVSLCQTSDPVNLSSLAFVGKFVWNACVCFEMQMILEISSSE